MDTTPAPLSTDELDTALTDLPGWRSRGGALHTGYAAPSAAAALALIAAVGEAAEAAGHHPDVDWRYDHVFIRLTTHSAGDAVTARDVELAGRISALAETAGATAEPEPDGVA